MITLLIKTKYHSTTNTMYSLSWSLRCDSEWCCRSVVILGVTNATETSQNTNFRTNPVVVHRQTTSPENTHKKDWISLYFLRKMMMIFCLVDRRFQHNPTSRLHYSASSTARGRPTIDANDTSEQVAPVLLYSSLCRLHTQLELFVAVDGTSLPHNTWTSSAWQQRLESRSAHNHSSSKIEAVKTFDPVLVSKQIVITIIFVESVEVLLSRSSDHSESSCTTPEVYIKFQWVASTLWTHRVRNSLQFKLATKTDI